MKIKVRAVCMHVYLSTIMYMYIYLWRFSFDYNESKYGEDIDFVDVNAITDHYDNRDDDNDDDVNDNNYITFPC